MPRVGSDGLIVTQTFIRTFSGALDGTGITGILVFSERTETTSQVSANSISMPVTLR